VPIELIAELSSNHGGSIPLAKEFIKRFADAGADFVKFQSYQVQTLRPDDPQYAWLQQAELSDDAHHELIAACRAAGTKFLTTIFHASRAPFLASLGLEAIKVGSGEAHEPSIHEAVKVFPRVIVSHGLGGRPASSAHENLACVSWYPAPHGLVPLYFGPWNEYIGWSDHCWGTESCELAIIRGARIIEKHVYLEHQPRPPRLWELDVTRFKSLRAFADNDPQRFLGRWQHV
jgi:N,N'-diacetyllegionaminate synthase